MTAGTWGAVEQVREALKNATAAHLRENSLLPEWAAPSSDALARLEAVCQAADRYLNMPTGITISEFAIRESNLREALERVRAVREAKPEGGEA